jgi:hypothetical protein
MTEFGQGHPCSGKDCKDCETCIFDEDLFIDKVQPNKRKDIMSSNLCNFCTNLEKSFEHREPGRFDAACRAVTYDTWSCSRPRRIDYNLSQTQDIVRPSWCPLNNPNNKHMALPSSSQPSTPLIPPYTPKSQNLEELRKKPVDSLTYSEKRELMKELPKHLEWDEIEEGKTYVIPRIMNQLRKVVKVSSKTSGVCVCHEINESTGDEYTFSCNIYPSDLDVVFITEFRKF